MKFYNSNIATNKGDFYDIAIVNFDNFDTNSVESDISVPIHHIQIIDRSGSMYCDIDDLIENVKQTIEHMNKDDYYSVIWFSGKNEFRTILKGIPRSADTHQYFAILDSIKSVIGLTCFNEATSEAINIANELKDLCDTVSITLFTDGMSTVANDNVAMTDLINEISKNHNDRIIAFNTIGYGDYCEESLLSNWSNKTQYGVFTHQSKINQYFSIFDSNREVISDISANKLNMRLEGSSSKSVRMYYSTNSFVRKIEDNLLSYSMCPSKNQIILISRESMKDVSIVVNDIEYKVSEIESNVSQTWFDSIFYKAAYAEYVSGNIQLSLEYLNIVGDKPLIDDHINSFNKYERSRHTAWLKNTIRSTKRRSPNSAPIDYISDSNVPCVIDLLSVIALNGCLYDPRHTTYSRIGKKVEDKFNMFVADEDMCKIEDIVFNEEHLNVSIRFRMNGYVRINPRQASDVGIDSNYPCSIFRTHTIVKDGNFNVNEIKIKVDSDPVKDYIRDNFKYAIESDYDDCFVISLDKIPVVNRSYNSVTIDEIYTRTRDNIIMKSYLKVIKYLISELSKNNKSSDSTLTPDQLKLLGEYSIRNGIYNGIDNKTPVNDACDFYITRTAKFYIKGFSSSSVLSPVAKIIGGKAKTSDKYMIEALEKYQDKDDINELRVIEKKLRNDIVQNTKVISASKIAVFLTGDFYTELIPTNKEDVYSYDPGNGDILCAKIGYDREYFTVG